MAAVEVKILKKKAVAPPTSLKQRLAADLGALLPADAFAFAVPEEGETSSFVPRPSTSSGRGAGDERLGMRMAGLPGIIIVHRGRALGLELSRANRHLSDDQRTMFARLRAAGMRIEVARSFAEALSALREMGLELAPRESLTRQVAELFRDARGYRARGGA